jgi:hypothetical protein
VNRNKIFYSILELGEEIKISISSNKIDSEGFKKIFSEAEKKFGEIEGDLIIDSNFSTLEFSIKKGIDKNKILDFIHSFK